MLSIAISTLRDFYYPYFRFFSEEKRNVYVVGKVKKIDDYGHRGLNTCNMEMK